MNTSINSAMLEEIIEPLARCFTPDVARKIVGFRASDALQSKLDELADKCSEGTLKGRMSKTYRTNSMHETENAESPSEMAQIESQSLDAVAEPSLGPRTDDGTGFDS